jgi:hypothetical protein
VNAIVYDRGLIRYSTFDAPKTCTDVLRLSFEPQSITGDGKELAKRSDLDENGFTTEALPDGDCIVTIRHDNLRDVVVKGNDPQEIAENDALTYVGEWQTVRAKDARQGFFRAAAAAGATMTLAFTGNQVRLIGSVDDRGGLADIYIDSKKQMTVLDCWGPKELQQQILYRKGGLGEGKHELKIVARGEKNPRSNGAGVNVDAVQYSAAKGSAAFGEGGGPTGKQRLLFGYTGRKDYVDSTGGTWHPAAEFVIKPDQWVDAVSDALYTQRRSMYIGNTPDPELYRYGVHGKDFRINITAGPGKYCVKLLFADTNTKSVLRAEINGQEVIKQLKVAEAAGGIFRAYDATFHGVEPKNGIIEIHLTGVDKAEASVQAVEVGPERPETQKS